MFELTPYVNTRNFFTDPFRMLDEFDRAFRSSDRTPAFRTDIRDDGDAYELLADLPGCRKEDISIDLDGDYMTVRATRQSETEDTRDSFLRMERSFGSFSRSFDVSGIKTDEITADYENGVLKLRLPKSEPETPKTRKIEIR